MFVYNKDFYKKILIFNIPLLLPTVLCIFFFVPIYLILLGLFTYLLPSFPFSSCSTLNWDGYNTCDREVFFWAITGGFILSQIPTWLITKFIASKIKYKLIDPVWGSILLIIQPIFYISIFKILSWSIVDGRSRVEGPASLLFLILSISSYSLAIFINYQYSNKRNRERIVQS